MQVQFVLRAVALSLVTFGLATCAGGPAPRVPPGYVIPPHRHLLADEIIFVHRGSGVARLGERESPFSAGATIYIPRNVTVSLRNTGSSPLGIAFIFSEPGFEELQSETSVLEGQPILPLSKAEHARIREKHRSHVIYEQP